MIGVSNAAGLASKNSALRSISMRITDPDNGFV